VAIAETRDGEIVSVDSMQVYRNMDIGTAKADAAMQSRVPHHLLDLVDPAKDFTVAEFQEAGRAALDDIRRRSQQAVIVGGSGLHFRSLVDPMTFAPSDPEVRATLEASSHADLVVELVAADPEAESHVDLANPRRVIRAVEVLRLTGQTPTARAGTPEYKALRRYEPLHPVTAVGFDPGAALVARVADRFDAMMRAGLLDEVEALAPCLGRTARQAVGYKQLLPVLSGAATLADAREDAIAATLSLAKRQRTFFRRDPRIRWLPWQDHAVARSQAAIAALQESA
jgi:tRNA dimethylallyltransferase